MKCRPGRIVVYLAALAIAITPLLSQTQPAQKPSFEVASVKSSQARGRGRMTADGGRFTATNVDLFSATLSALQEQGGLKLESSRGPNSVLVIDSVQKPAEN
jgi:Protein of unknown function (DUF3738)